MKSTNLEIAHTWDGAPVGADERVRLQLALDGRRLALEVDAPFHGDPAPPAPAGSLDGLWEFEVVELFLLGADERYVELELGPFGHYLALELEGARRVRRRGLPLAVGSERGNGRWHARAELDAALLPPGLRAGNACAMHGQGPARRYLSCHPLPGPQPDFHRLHGFRPLDWSR